MGPDLMLTREERASATYYTSVDTHFETRETIGRVQLMGCIVAICCLATFLLRWGEDFYSGLGIAIGVLVCLIGGVVRMFFTEVRTESRISSDDNIRERMKKTAQDRIAATGNATEVCSYLNTQRPQVPTWARLTPWGWSIDENRVNLGRTVFSAELTATNERGETASRTIALNRETKVMLDAERLGYFRQAVHQEISEALYALSHELLIVEPTAPKSPYDRRY